jgi:mono/diheme cytochrome c family protein
MGIVAGVACVAATAVLGGGSTGSYTYKTYCANCHGMEGKGDGKLASMLTVKPTDLTRIAARNDGEFVADEVRARIDGREVVPLHGPSDMPIWGDAFSQSDQAGGRPEEVKERIDELVDFLRTLQVPEKKK